MFGSGCGSTFHFCGIRAVHISSRRQWVGCRLVQASEFALLYFFASLHYTAAKISWLVVGYLFTLAGSARRCSQAMHSSLERLVRYCLARSVHRDTFKCPSVPVKMN
jgi:hypothetical protein